MLVFNVLFALSIKTDDEFVKIIDKVLYPMLGEKEKTQTQPVGDVPEFEDLAGSSAVTPVQDQVRWCHTPHPQLPTGKPRRN